MSIWNNLKDSRGFTLIELLSVFIILGIMAQMTLVFVLEMKARSHDVMAISDGRNLFTAVRDNFVNLEDVDYTQVTGSEVGIKTTGGAARSAVFELSPGVKIRTIAGSSGTPDMGFFQIYLYHEAGTDLPTPSGKKEFYYLASEPANQYILAEF
jgi:prepilin-type N-terminal cleavage/methylation domain-containing protein